MKERGIDGTVYSHPIGLHGHGAGPLIGLWDHQEGVPGRGDAQVIPSTWFSIELQATTPVPEWGAQPVRMAQEEDAVVGDAHECVEREDIGPDLAWEEQAAVEVGAAALAEDRHEARWDQARSSRARICEEMRVMGMPTPGWQYWPV